MSNPNNGVPKLSLKVVTNKEKTKVLFAEANSDFINVLLSFLVLPLGKVASILRKHNGEGAAAIGSLNTLYKGLLELDETYFCARSAKQMLINPPSSLGAECCTLALDISDSLSINNHYFVCQDQYCGKYGSQNVSLYSDIAKCECGKSLNRDIRAGDCLDAETFISAASFIITDDLRVAPMTGIIQTLNNLGIAGIEVAEMESVTLGFNEIRDLLMFSLTSATPLTDTIIKKRQTSSSAAKPEPGVFSQHQIQKDDANSRKMVLKVCLQRSTNRFLFAVATHEFVDLLFSFLTIPLGGVEFLLGGNTGLNSMDNFYRNISNDINDEYFTTPKTKTQLINPKLPHGYISKNQFLPLSEEAPPKLYYKYNGKHYEFSSHGNSGRLVPSFKLNEELYVKRQTMCIVTDDLTVSSSLATSFSIVSGLGIPLSDVKEMELQIGLEEALNILKASLTSKTAITDGLIKPMLNKLPKLERKRKLEG